MADNHRFVIWAPRYTERSGGVLVLHYLCHYLNGIGYESFLWPKDKVLREGTETFYERFSSFRKELRRRARGVKPVSPSLNTPIASAKELQQAIVVYPERIAGNPLKAAKVVRWFLHKPGHHTGLIDFGKNELYFYYQPVFDDPSLSARPTRPLFFNVILTEIFKQSNFGPRTGTCFILRKGKKRTLQHNLEDGIVIDDLSNEEISAVFNRVEYCISYDMHTFYSQYAALCGCKSIVVPEPGLDKEAWQPMEGLRYGIAYGKEDLDWAAATRGQMLDFLRHEESMNLQKVRTFADECIQFFS